MIAAGHQPAFMPWLGLLHKIASCDVFISWDTVQMEDSGFENRNQIMTAKGPQMLTVPCRRGRALKIRDVEIVNEQGWQRKHWRSIELAYGRAPFWEKHSPFLRHLYDTKFNTLAALNQTVLDYLMLQFRITGKRMLSLSNLNVPGAKNELIINACHAVGAHKYLFGSKGVDYANNDLFAAANVEPFVQEYKAVPYSQSGTTTFAPNMCAFDLLFNVERDNAIEIMMKGGQVRRLG